jgi:hypothetical protein
MSIPRVTSVITILRKAPRGLWSAGLVWAAVSMTANAGVSVTPVPLLASDDFDTGNTPNAAPFGWKVSAPAGTGVRVVDASVIEPASAPDCVELRDDSPKARPEMYRDFTPAEAGRASASFRLNSTATAHAALQLRSARAGHLCSVVFADNGMMRYEGAGGNIISATRWTAGQWLSLQIEWFSDFTYTASLGGATIVERAHFATNAIPAKIYVSVGYGAVTNKIGYVDDIKVMATDTK